MRLFDRVGRRVHLTAGGDDLLRRCRAILADTEDLVERGRALGSGTTGVLRVGTTPQTIESVLAPFVPRLRRAHPGVELQVVEDGGLRLLALLDRGEIHLARTAASDERLARRELFPAVAMAVMRRTHPLAKRPTVDVAALASMPLLLLRREFGTRQWFDAACQAQRVRPRILLESAAPQAIVALAGSPAIPAPRSSMSSRVSRDARTPGAPWCDARRSSRHVRACRSTARADHAALCSRPVATHATEVSP